MAPSLSVIIVNWNHGHLVQGCLDSLLAQEYPRLDVTVVDNGSQDSSPQQIARRYPDLRLRAFTKNRGFAAALNWGLSHTAGDWVLSLNPDTVVQQNFLQEMLHAVASCEENRQQIGMVAPKLLQPPVLPNHGGEPAGRQHLPSLSRESTTTPATSDLQWNPRSGNPQGPNGKAPPPWHCDHAYGDPGKPLSNVCSTTLSIIDSTGLFIDRRRRPYDRGQGQPDRGQYDTQTHIFGACGAAALYRRAMLEDLALDGECFAESFFAYYEDADLAWRAQLRGWRSVYAPRAVATHARGRGDTLRQPGRAPKDATGPRLALRNRYLMAIRNDTVPDLLADLPHILAAELPRLVYATLTRPRILLGLMDLARALPAALRQRRQIQSRRAVDAQAIRRWFLLL
jgi:GT2 family glycosyltransferase